MLGRIESKARQRGGGDTPTHLSRARSDKIARHSEHRKKNYDSAGGGEPLNFCVYRFHYLKKKGFGTVD